MDPVDVLTVAVHAARLIRSRHDPEQALAGPYEALGLERPDRGGDPLDARVARVAHPARSDRHPLLEFLHKQAGPLPLKRPEEGWGGEVQCGAGADEEPDAEAEDLVDYAESEEVSARE